LDDNGGPTRKNVVAPSFNLRYNSIMTAVGLFDILASDQIIAADAARSSDQLRQLAEKLIAASLADLERVREYESNLAMPQVHDPAVDLKLSRSIWQLYKDWAADAEQVLGRARSLMGVHVEGAERLDDAIGRILARVSVAPEQIAKAKQQVREGQFIPAKELRDELNARLRA
jgi:hypothetical protein